MSANRSRDAEPETTLVRAWRLVSDFDAPVTRQTYLVTGLALFVLKLVVDYALMEAFSTGGFSAGTYLHPLLTARLDGLGEHPEWLTWVLGLWALPFALIGVTMSIRRSLDAGLSGYLGLLFLVPTCNFFAIAALAAMPTQEPETGAGLRYAAPARPLTLALLTSTLVAASIGIGATLTLVFVVGEYGGTLFFGAPFVIGWISARQVYRAGHTRRRVAFAAAALSVVTTGAMLLLFALEGVLCLAMAAPLALPLALLGGFVGHAIASRTPTDGPVVFAVVLALPFAGLLETQPLELHEVVTTVHVDAPPEVVFRNVVAFSELPPDRDWVLRLGIASPLRARIDGEGVGAVRHCEFTTGAFVEPITVWDPPHRLAFDVVDQPPSMQEWSPFESVNAPHLVGALSSQRGQFRLERLPDGGTRLEGTTWYTLDLAPNLYWRLYSDVIIHRIHRRVLDHVRALSVAEHAGAETALRR